ncbi:MAG: DUF4124 domain-containing protein [Pseudomonadota bacterium]
MASSNRAVITALACLWLASGGVNADQTVYRWVDEDGVVHVSDQKPDHIEAREIIVPTGGPTRSAPAPAKPVVPAARAPDARAPQAAPRPQPSRAVPLTQMTLEQLDERCETAREVRLGPLRAAQIAQCKDEGEGDEDWCERYYADYGEGGRTASGRYRPGMFRDIAECKDALEERRRRALD